ncbi:MAG TPA: AraC family transcriptional regulator [Clostridiaceae bacterium]|nr:AraC family transcriptional regulator [Clostridiaceae bacterium]
MNFSFGNNALEYIGFNLENAIKCVDAYSISTNVRTIIIDSQGETIYESCGNKKLCKVCKSISTAGESSQSCSKAHLYGSYQAERFGGKYVFFCPMGFTHWASPITLDGMMKGAVLGGPVNMIEPEDFLIDDLIIRNNVSEQQLASIKENIHEIPVINPERVNHLSELLFIVAAHISDIQPSRYLEEREFNEHHSGISEYIHYIKTMGGDDKNIPSYPLDKEKELLYLISIGDKAGSQKILNEIFGHIFFSTGGNFNVIKARVLELIVLLSRAALEGGADVEQIFGLNYKFLNQIHGFTSIEELSFWLSKIMARFTDCVFNLAGVKHVDVIYRAINYIKHNYMKKITLEEVASHVYLSPSYFSKIFKEEMKYSFNAYLNYVRIEMSKKLLLDDSIDLIEVSNMVGYEDQSYFSKVFKKITGISPGKYRESRGQHRPGGSQ